MVDPSRVRVTGPLVSYVDGFWAELTAVGYTSWSVEAQLRLMAHVSRWLVTQGLGVDELTSGAAGAKATEWSPSVRAMQAGEMLPPKEADGWVIEPPVGSDGPVSDWFIETEFSDIRGARWRLRNDRSRSETVAPRRVRTRPFQLWHPLRPES